jgi:hypothetical protein
MDHQPIAPPHTRSLKQDVRLAFIQTCSVRNERICLNITTSALPGAVPVVFTEPARSRPYLETSRSDNVIQAQGPGPAITLGPTERPRVPCRHECEDETPTGRPRPSFHGVPSSTVFIHYGFGNIFRDCGKARCLS